VGSAVTSVSHPLPEKPSEQVQAQLPVTPLTVPLLMQYLKLPVSPSTKLVATQAEAVSHVPPWYPLAQVQPHEPVVPLAVPPFSHAMVPASPRSPRVQLDSVAHPSPS
jgi:hypothetical protein